ncbi:hypothetical protein [Paenibacillus sp. MMO-58]|uniref:hypothetical protein n=1 Tax=Paenibacillus sp. MMO-58 TaxID=3081290 RepID=UPI0030166824
MKRKYLVFSSLLIILLLVVALEVTHFGGKQRELVYVYDESIFHEFTIDDSGYVTFRCDITIRNRSKTEVKFYMTADVTKDIGLTKGKFAYSFEGESQNYKVYTIAPNSKQTYPVEFTALSGDKKTKKDRLPPKEVILTSL